MARAKRSSDDGWPPVIYRQRTDGGKVGWSVGLKRPPTRLVAVIDHDGPLDPSTYALKPFNLNWRKSKRVFFRTPRLTRGLTILYECAA